MDRNGAPRKTGYDPSKTGKAKELKALASRFLGLAPIQKAHSRPESLFTVIPGAPLVSEGDHTAPLETAQAAQIVGGGFRRELEGRSIQADATEELSAHLLHGGEDVFDSRPDPGKAGVATCLAGGQRLAFLGLALDVYPPALSLEAPLAFTIDVTFVAIKIATGVRVIQDILQV